MAQKHHGVNLLPYTGAGSGIIRALKFTPDISFENNEVLKEFVITIKRKTTSRVQEAHQEMHQVAHQETHQEGNQVTNQEGNQVTNQVDRSKPQLTKAQKDIVNFCSIPRTAKEILDRLELSNQTFNRKKYIQPLLDMGVLEMTNPEKPNDKNQKYRKVRK